MRRRTKTRSRANRVFLAIVAGLAAALILLVLDGIWAGRLMFRGVSSSRSALVEGTVAVTSGDPEAAVPFFEHAGEAASSAVSATGHPSIRLLSRLPWLGDNIDAVEAVAQASEQTSQAGLAMVQAAEILDWRDLRLPATEAIGVVDLPTLRQARPFLDQVAKTLGIAAARLEAADTGRLVGPVAAGYDDALETLERRARIATDARDLALLLPRFLAAGGSKSYLLAVQALGVPQGTGGRVDLVGALEANGGDLSLQTPLTPAGDAFAEATLSPDGPTAGEALLEAARLSGLGEFDGVVLIDSIWLRDALWVVGSVEVEGRTLPLTMDNGAVALELDAFEGTDEAASEEIRASWANSIVESYLTRRPSTEAFAIGSAGDVAGRHLTLYLTAPKEQALLARLGATGAYDPGINPLAVTWRSIVRNHAAVFTRKVISHTVLVGSDGSARVRTVIDLANQSPEGPPSVLVGLPVSAIEEEPAGVNPVGGWAADLRLALPPSATKITAETSIPSETQVVREEGGRFALATLATDPGDSMSLIVTYTIKRAVVGNSNVFRMMVLPQPAFSPTVVRVRIDTPGRSHDPGCVSRDGAGRHDGAVRRRTHGAAPALRSLVNVLQPENSGAEARASASGGASASRADTTGSTTGHGIAATGSFHANPRSSSPVNTASTMYCRRTSVFAWNPWATPAGM